MSTAGQQAGPSGLSPIGHALITTFGLGHMRPASGTWGSLPPVVVCAAMLWWGTSVWAWLAVLAAVLVVFSLACIVWGDWAEATFGKKDPGQVVADETAGMALTLMCAWPAAVAPAGEPGLSAWHMIVLLCSAFVLFRVMDIIKPPPARGLQRLPGGWGILIDDLLAGAYAGAGVLLLRWWIL